MLTGPDQDPQTRLKVVADNASNVHVSPDMKAIQYFRSGREMLRSAVNYHEDGNPEHAYVLYMRFLT
jgi:hypothetical protein